MSKRIAFVTCTDMPELWTDDQLVLPFLPHEYVVESHPWNEPGVAWHRFEAVIVRSCWDYCRLLPDFLQWLDHCEKTGVRLYNPAAVMRWNLDKHYLRELADNGVRIPDTHWFEPGDPVDLPAIFAEKNWSEAVIKPAVSLGAIDTWVIGPDNMTESAERARALLADGKSMLLQPFLPEITAEGEWSLLFFNGVFSHALLKTAKPGDFRVQHVHGGAMHPAEAPEWMRQTAEDILHHLPEPMLYARVDGVASGRAFVLMELELIEPVLYLAQGAQAPEQWAQAIRQRIAHKL